MWTRSSAHRSPAHWTRVFGVALVLALVTVALRWPVLTITQPIDDEVNYSVVAHEMLHGARLYADIVERRPPATFWVYGAVFRIFGPENWRALHAVGIGWVLLTMAMLYLVGCRVAGRRGGVVAALLYSVLQPWWYWGNLAFNGEVLMNLPIAAAFAVGLRTPRRGRRTAYASAGALVAMAFLLKQPGGVAIVPLAVYLLHPSRGGGISLTRRVRDVLWLTAGFAALLAGAVAWVARLDVLAPALYWSIFNHDVPHVFWGRALVHGGAFTLIALPAILAALWAIQRRACWQGLTAERDALVTFAVVSAFGAAASGRFFPHYFIGLLPAVAWLAAAGWTAAVSDDAPRPRLGIVAIGSAWLCVAATATLIAQERTARTAVFTTQAGRYIRDHASPDARVFVWGRAPRIYLDSRARPAGRYIDSFALTGRIFGPRLRGVDTSRRIVPGAWDQLKADFEAHPPEFIVDTESGPDAEYPVSQFPWLRTYLHDGYEPVATTVDGTVFRSHANVTDLARMGR